MAYAKCAGRALKEPSKSWTAIVTPPARIALKLHHGDAEASDEVVVTPVVFSDSPSLSYVGVCQ